MTPEQFEKFLKLMEERIDSSVAIGIEKNVNGKIRNLDQKFVDYVNGDMQWKTIDSAWKKNAEPAIQLGNDARASGRAALFFLGVLTSVAVIITAFIEALKKH